MFFTVGYNREKEDGLKHYRRFYPDELENVKEVFNGSPFMEEKVYRMAQTGGFFSSDDSSKNVAFEVGKFKGLVKVFNQTKYLLR